jgi:hypothetical protein
MSKEKLETKFLNKLEPVLIELFPLKQNAIHEAISKSSKDIETWLSGLPAPTSELNIRLYFIQILTDRFPVREVLDDEKVLSVLLDDIGVRKIGDSIDRNGKKWKVIWRKIGINFGIEMGLKASDGEILSEEFYD